MFVVYELTRYKVNLAKNQLRSWRIPKKGLMTELIVAKNNIQQLNTWNFLELSGFKVLQAQQNQIEWIESLTFQSVRNNLKHLDLSYNLLKSLNCSVQNLFQLTYLNLRSNLISVFEEKEFRGVDNLNYLDISENRVATIGSHLHKLSSLRTLILSNNSIENLKMEQMPPRLHELSVISNPIMYDCELFPFLQWLNNSTGAPKQVNIDIFSSSQFQNYGQTCPSGCHCSCTSDEKMYFVTVDCSSRNISVLPQFLSDHSIDDSSYVETEFPSYYFEVNFRAEMVVAIIDTVGEIDLSNNNLDSLENARFPVGLKYLYLHNNNLKTLYSVILADLSNLHKVSLFGNPWSCDCSALDFRRWILAEKEKIENVNQTLCFKELGKNIVDGKAIWAVDDRDLCPTFIGLYSLLGVGLILIVLAATILKLVHTKYAINISVWLYAHGVTMVKEKDNDKYKFFDAFLSFSHKDQDLVIKRIITEIETKQPMTKLCLYYKHFKARDFISENIFHAIQNSKRTVFVLSRNFLESEWCIYEFRAAHLQALKDKVNCVIIIKLGELPDDIDPDIKLYLDSTTYLTWGEKYFFDKLLYALPTSDHLKSKTQDEIYTLPII